LTAQEARRRLAEARVARLATLAAGAPRLVPITFALADDTIWTAVDDVKPKRTRALARLAQIAADPRVCVLADRYEEDWRELWWVRADGRARVLDAADTAAAAGLAALARRYAPYREQPPAGPVIAIEVERWSGWAAA
jgi:PPOX class probable F420-dependent enzyme